ncbi:MAG TPA: hypothetical protein VFM20_01610 [Nitrososphaeraceae archaeon]|nr:hypothetical protein [Nitrososphaeraceae archaeon]
MAKVKISGKKMIGKSVKSFDGKDLGEIKSISSDYVELKHGNDHYFIPKLHVKEFDKENLYVLLMKDEVKDRYERNNPPLPSEVKYAERTGQGYAGYHEVIPFMSKEPDLQLKGQESGDILTIPWEQVIHKHVRTSDNIDIGDVDKVGNEFIVVRDGVANIHLYYIPKAYISNYDGSSLWIDVPSGLVAPKFERQDEPSQEEIEMLVNEVPD